MSEKVIVIGGGAAGLIAAGRLGERGKTVMLIEKNPMLGKKLRITGKGRCNITNDCETEDIFKNVPTNSSFLYSAIYTFSNESIIALLNGLGLETKVERGGRVFPVSDNSKDVVDTLKKYVLKNGVKVYQGEVNDILCKDGIVYGVSLSDGKKFKCDSLIIATGGKSYPSTGSTGDGYRFAKKLGHTIMKPKPSLVPLETYEKWVKDIMGLSLKNIEITIVDENNKKIYTDFGEMIFTHFGVSGPVILSASAHLKDIESKKYKLKIDLKPALDAKQLDNRILRDFSELSRKHFSNALDALLPKNLIPIIVDLSGIDPHKEVNQISKSERMKLIELLKGLTLSIKGFRPIEEAIITSGGICVKQIDPSTMQSKLIKGLYFAGEIIDVDAYTGGFNLQIAFSTGYLAGDNA